NVPVQVSGITSAVAIAGNHTGQTTVWQFGLALLQDGSVWSWGALGTRSGKFSTPMQVQFPGGVKIAAISAGDCHALALDTNGNVWAWGQNDYGQLGDGTQVQSPAPKKVPGLSGIRAIAAGTGFSLALG